MNKWIQLIIKHDLTKSFGITDGQTQRNSALEKNVIRNKFNSCEKIVFERNFKNHLKFMN